MQLVNQMYVSYLISAGRSVAATILVFAIGPRTFAYDHLPNGTPSTADAPHTNADDDAALTARLKDLAHRGDPEAQFDYARRVETGIGTKRDETGAAKWYQEAAQNGRTPAAIALVRISLARSGPERDPAEAMKWLLWAADRGDSNAEVLVAWCFHVGLLRHDSTIDNTMQGIAGVWLRSLLAEPDEAKWNFIEVDLKMLGFMNHPIPTQARLWYEKAARHGDDYANFQLCCFYHANDVKQETVHLDQIVAHGNPYWLGQVAYLQVYLGIGDAKLREVGQGRARRAVELLTPLAEAGAPDAMRMVSLLVSEDQGLASRWRMREYEARRRLAESGDLRNVYAVGDAFMVGSPVKTEPKEALKWFARAAEAGHPLAQYRLGLCYQRGVGVKIDDAEAGRWFAKAAEQGITRVVGVALGF